MLADNYWKIYNKQISLVMVKSRKSTARSAQKATTTAEKQLYICIP